MANARYAFKYTCAVAASDIVRNASLVGEGVVLVAPTHWLLGMLPVDRVGPARGAFVELHFRDVEFLMAEAFIFPKTILSADISWTIRLERFAMLGSEVDAIGGLEEGRAANMQSLRRSLLTFAKIIPAVTLTLLDAHFFNLASGLEYFF